MSDASPRRSGRIAFVSFIVLFLVFAALVIWLVTAPVRELRNRPQRPAEAPAGQAAPGPAPQAR